MSKKETQESIYQWATETFGPADLLSTVERAEEEMDELLEAAESFTRQLHKHGDAIQTLTPQLIPRALSKMVTEAADISIVLKRFAEIARRQGHAIGALLETLDEAEQQKMATNRARVWIVFGNGHGRHARYPNDTEVDTPMRRRSRRRLCRDACRGLSDQDLATGIIQKMIEVIFSMQAYLQSPVQERRALEVLQSGLDNLLPRLSQYDKGEHDTNAG